MIFDNLHPQAKIWLYLSPIKIDNELITPHELAYGTKPDLCNLLPMFSVALLPKYRTSNGKKILNVETIPKELFLSAALPIQPAPSSITHPPNVL